MPRIPDVSNDDGRPVVHHFDEPSWRAWRPGFATLQEHPSEILASQAPLDQLYLATDGGALGTPGYVALPGHDADQFYAESTPIWWVPPRLYDLRDTWAAFYLKAVTPIRVAAGYSPHLFIAATFPDPGVARGFSIDGWFLATSLEVGQGEWTYNEVHLANDPNEWVHYVDQPRTLDWTLGHCGFIGWMYLSDKNFRGVRANGTMGWDEFCFNLRERDLPRVRDGHAPEHALEI
jgi:hypothetical protein